MATLVDFKELNVWKKSKDLSVKFYSYTKNNSFKQEIDLERQMKRSVLSVPSNIAEGFSRQGNKEFIHFLYIALGSLSEFETQLIIANELNIINADLFLEFISEIVAIRKMSISLINSLKKSEFKGAKFISEPNVQYFVNDSSEI